MADKLAKHNMKDGLLKKCLRIVVIQVKITIFACLIGEKPINGMVKLNKNNKL